MPYRSKLAPCQASLVEPVSAIDDGRLVLHDVMALRDERMRLKKALARHHRRNPAEVKPKAVRRPDTFDAKACAARIKTISRLLKLDTDAHEKAARNIFFSDADSSFDGLSDDEPGFLDVAEKEVKTGYEFIGRSAKRAEIQPEEQALHGSQQQPQVKVVQGTESERAGAPAPLLPTRDSASMRETEDIQSATLKAVPAATATAAAAATSSQAPASGPFPGIDRANLLVPRFCPLRCGAMVIGKNRERHLSDECPRRQALCPDGCGNRVIGADLESHRSTCPMGILLDRAERAVHESAMRELHLALEGIHEERSRAVARCWARGEQGLIERGWASKVCAARVLTLEVASRDVIARQRRRANDRLGTAIAQLNANAESMNASLGTGTTSALRLLDALQGSATGRGPGPSERTIRPWHLELPELQPLLEALEAAAACCADERLRRRGEAALMASLRRFLEAVQMPLTDSQKPAMEAGLQQARDALMLVELEDVQDLPDLLRRAEAQMHRAALRELDAAVPDFHAAVAAGDLELCSWFLEREQANPSLPCPKSGILPLVMSTKKGDIPMCELLLEHRAEIDGRGRADGLSALHWAAHQRDARTMAKLLEGRANPRLQDKKGQDALMKLVRRDIVAPAEGCRWSWHVEHQRLHGRLLHGLEGMDIESAKLTAESTADCVGFCFGHSDALDGVVTHHHISFHAAGSTVARVTSPKGEHDGTATKQEGEENEEEEERAMKATNWISYLKIATEAAHDVRMLLTALADASATDRGGLTPLHHHLLSSPSGGSTAAVEMLLRGGADVNKRDHTAKSTTPFLLVVAGRRDDLVQLMLKHAWPPADVDSRTADGTTALALAETAGSLEVANLLRGFGARVWADAEVRLGPDTTYSFDTRFPPLLA